MTDLFLPQGPEFFEDIITGGCYYVDKTSFIVRLLDKSSKQNVKGTPVSIFNRPRRFGKTLNLTALKAFVDIAKDSRALFAKLKVSQYPELCAEWQNQWPVIFVTFKDIYAGNIEEAIPEFRELARKTVEAHKFLMESPRVSEDLSQRLKAYTAGTADPSELPYFLSRLVEAMYYHYERKVIVLIDEYDVPLSKANTAADYDPMIRFMRTCLSPVLKTNTFLCFAVLTGCLRLAGESLFTGLNNFKCYPLTNGVFAEDFGFTHEEVKGLLKAYDTADLYDEMQEWYDGYNIGGIRVFNPWSAMSFLDDKTTSRSQKPQTYWANTGSTADLEFFIQKFEFALRGKLEALLRGESIEAMYDEHLAYKNLFARAENFWTLMFASGYLTLKDGAQSDGEQLQLVLPNREIKKILIDIADRVFKNFVSRENTTALYRAFFDQDAKSVSEQISAYAKRSISYYDYNERFYHALTLGMFVNFSGDVTSNPEAGEGRPDIVLASSTEPTVLIIEIKAVKDQSKAEDALEAALSQIEDRKYAEQYLADGSKVIKCALAYYRKECRARFA